MQWAQYCGSIHSDADPLGLAENVDNYSSACVAIGMLEPPCPDCHLPLCDLVRVNFCLQAWFLISKKGTIVVSTSQVCEG